MLSLNSQLSTIGISAAKGVDLVMQRDQLNNTLPTQADSAKSQAAADDSRKPAAKRTLTAEQQRQVDELRQTDRKVRDHEQAHISAGRELITSGPNYTYTYGPDGRQYVTGGEVGIDTSPEREPQANIDKGARVQAAALAPQDPSPEDYSVAAQGKQLEDQGRTDLSLEQQAAQTAARNEDKRRAEAATAAQDEPASARRRLQTAYTPSQDAAARLSIFA